MNRNADIKQSLQNKHLFVFLFSTEKSNIKIAFSMKL